MSNLVHFEQCPQSSNCNNLEFDGKYLQFKNLEPF